MRISKSMAFPKISQLIKYYQVIISKLHNYFSLIFFGGQKRRVKPVTTIDFTGKLFRKTLLRPSNNLVCSAWQLRCGDRLRNFIFLPDSLANCILIEQSLSTKLVCPKVVVPCFRHPWTVFFFEFTLISDSFLLYLFFSPLVFRVLVVLVCMIAIA